MSSAAEQSQNRATVFYADCHKLLSQPAEEALQLAVN
jgi:hypothetical protein